MLHRSQFITVLSIVEHERVERYSSKKKQGYGNFSAGVRLWVALMDFGRAQ